MKPTNRNCKHNWKSYNLEGITFRCSVCGRYGNEVKRHNHKTGRDEYVIKPLPKK
jgi:hypothetical protein